MSLTDHKFGMTNSITAKPAKNDLVTEVVTVSPGMAKAWLDRNTGNRRLKATLVNRLADEMRRGSWKMTGEAIKFATDGRLLDGQHRLTACVKADVPFRTLVIYRIDGDAQNVMDCGMPRLGRDVLDLNGVVNPNHVAVALRLLVNHAKRRTHYSGGDSSVSNSEIAAAYWRHPKLCLYVPASSQSVPRGVSRGLVGFINYVACTMMNQRPKANQMVDVLKTGVPAYDGDPIHAFRERIIKDSHVQKLLKNSVIYTFKHCWNAFAADRPMQRIVWRTDDVDIEGLDYSKL